MPFNRNRPKRFPKLISHKKITSLILGKKLGLTKIEFYLQLVAVNSLLDKKYFLQN